MPATETGSSRALFHITSEAEAGAAVRAGSYTPEAFAREGFVHCSYPHQVCAVANRVFGGRSGLVLLEVDRDRLPCRVVDENLEGGTELFPHVYGPLPMEAVVRVYPFPCDVEGRFELPPSAGGGAAGLR